MLIHPPVINGGGKNEKKTTNYYLLKLGTFLTIILDTIQIQALQSFRTVCPNLSLVRTNITTPNSVN